MSCQVFSLSLTNEGQARGGEKLNMRQLKGKVKETNKQKKERRKEFLENKQRVFTIVMPTIGVLFVLMVLYVYFKASRPKSNVEY